ncbi:MAG: hypothetical protein H6735_11025 [Alphaproteobacteria bacterium]|nr:hypothetical protein [Alphaproteobacteria bacterium]
MFLLTLAHIAHAADEPGLWMRQAVGFGGWPSGAVIDTRAQLRTPLHRSDSIVFQKTYAGAGGRLAVTPAYADVGPRVSIAPIDVFDLDLQASFVGYWPSSFGPMVFGDLGGTLSKDRADRPEDAVSTWALVLTAAPTLKLRVGPIVAFDAWTISHWRFHQPDAVDEPYTYEPYSDMVLAWTDTLLEHQAVVMATVLPGDGGPLLWLGPTFRDRIATGSGDRSTCLGGILTTRPIVASWAPQAVVQVLPYLKDTDRLGGVPNIQGQLFWVLD